MDRKKIGAISFHGGQKENVYFCLLESFAEDDRWFLSKLSTMKEIRGESKRDAEDMWTFDPHADEGGSGRTEDEGDEDEQIVQWVQEHKLLDLVVDFPLAFPPCANCSRGCESLRQCQDPQVIQVKALINDLLLQDKQFLEENPKEYERTRTKKDSEPGPPSPSGPPKSEGDVLSRSFRRKLKKGPLFYWNRPLDFWVWLEYYDQMLFYFQNAYDSFGHTSLILIFRQLYLKRQISPLVNWHEANASIILLEFLRAGLISKKVLQALSGIDTCAHARLAIIRQIEKTLKVFIYDYDVEVLVRKPRAFQSFLLALAGQRLLLGKVKKIPSWGYREEDGFIAPLFSPIPPT